MPDATNDDTGGRQQPNPEVSAEPRNALPTSAGSVAPFSHRQLEEVHVTLLCPRSRPNTTDGTAQLTRIISSATEPASRSAAEEDAVTANAQQCTVSHQQLLSIDHHTESRREQVSKQLSADPRYRYDHVVAGRLESELRGCECEQLHCAGSDLIADTMRNNRSAGTVFGEWHTPYHLKREVHTQGSALQRQ
ncbi:uncharacterized protein LOC144124222 [Amblyomma americanum]